MLFAVRNSTIGYCQGMNFIVNFILEQGFCPEESFWLLSHLLEDLLPMDYFISMETLMADQMILKHMIALYLPDLHKFFLKIQLDIGIVSIRWFLCLFTSSLLPNQIKTVIWDVLLLQGVPALFKTVLVLLKMLRKKIFKARDFVDGIRIIENNLDSISDPTLFLK